MSSASSSSTDSEDGPDSLRSGIKKNALEKALRPLVRWSKWRQAALRQEKREAQRELRAAALGANARRRPKADE